MVASIQTRAVVATASWRRKTPTGSQHKCRLCGLRKRQQAQRVRCMHMLQEQHSVSDIWRLLLSGMATFRILSSQLLERQWSQVSGTDYSPTQNHSAITANEIVSCVGDLFVGCLTSFKIVQAVQLYVPRAGESILIPQEIGRATMRS